MFVLESSLGLRRLSVSACLAFPACTARAEDVAHVKHRMQATNSH